MRAGADGCGLVRAGASGRRCLRQVQRVRWVPWMRAAGAQSGQQFRLKSKGMRVLRSDARGDMFVQVAVETPVSLSKKQKDLLKAFEAESPHERHSPEANGFFDKVKDLWKDLKE